MGTNTSHDSAATIRRFSGGPRSLQFRMARMADGEDEKQLARFRVRLLQAQGGSDDEQLAVWRLVREAIDIASPAGQVDPPAADAIKWTEE